MIKKYHFSLSDEKLQSNHLSLPKSILHGIYKVYCYFLIFL